MMMLTPIPIPESGSQHSLETTTLGNNTEIEAPNAVVVAPTLLPASEPAHVVNPVVEAPAVTPAQAHDDTDLG